MNSKQKIEFELSPRGRLRRQQMLEPLQSEVTRVRDMRRLRKSTSQGLMLVFVLSVGAWIWFAGESEQGPSPKVAQSDPASVPASMTRVVGNIDGIAEKYLVGNMSQSNPLEEISDHELLDFFAANGQPSVLGKINGETVLIPSTAIRSRAGRRKSQSL